MAGAEFRYVSSRWKRQLTRPPRRAFCGSFSWAHLQLSCNSVVQPENYEGINVQICVCVKCTCVYGSKLSLCCAITGPGRYVSATSNFNAPHFTATRFQGSQYCSRKSLICIIPRRLVCKLIRLQLVTEASSPRHARIDATTHISTACTFVRFISHCFCFLCRFCSSFEDA